MTRYRLVIDEEACWGCRTCEVACQQEFGLSKGIPYIRVVEHGPEIVNGRPDFSFKVRFCQHCDAPPCAEACAEEAIEIRDDGIVILNREKCIGCGQCAEECPFDAITFDPESGIAQKCNLCFQRIDSGLLPACADNICLAHCIHLVTNE